MEGEEKEREREKRAEGQVREERINYKSKGEKNI